jgi:hypothetical protein
MNKTILALAAAATIAASTLAPNSAEARWRGFVPGIIGGIVVGTIIGSAIASHPGYYTYDDYDEDAGPGCYWARRAWRDDEGRVHYSRPRRFCD